MTHQRQHEKKLLKIKSPIYLNTCVEKKKSFYWSGMFNNNTKLFRNGDNTL